jgi:hypothetical protein
MGHVPRTTDATGTQGGGVTEQDYARAVAAACGRLLAGKGGWSVKPINADVADAQYRGDAFFAVHCNGSLNPTIHGASVGHQNTAGAALAARWKAAYAARGWTRGFERDNNTVNLARYYGVREAIQNGNPRAVIIECGYLTNAEDRAMLVGPGVDRVALAIGDALGITQPTTEDDMDGFNENDRTALGWMAHRVLAIAKLQPKTTGNPPIGVTPEDIPIVTRFLALEAEVGALKTANAELRTLLTDLVSVGVALRASGEITIKAEAP